MGTPCEKFCITCFESGWEDINWLIQLRAKVAAKRMFSGNYRVGCSSISNSFPGRGGNTYNYMESRGNKACLKTSETSSLDISRKWSLERWEKMVLEENQPREVKQGLIVKSCGRHAGQCDFPAGKTRWITSWFRKIILAFVSLGWIGRGEIHGWEFKQEEIAALYVRDEQEPGLQSCTVRAQRNQIRGYFRESKRQICTADWIRFGKRRE